MRPTWTAHWAEFPRGIMTYPYWLAHSYFALHAGPQEATIHNLKREIAQVESELQQAQGSWHTQQKELHTLISSNAEAAEKLALLQSTHIMLEHNCARLERQCVFAAPACRTT